MIDRTEVIIELLRPKTGPGSRGGKISSRGKSKGRGKERGKGRILIRPSY
jgi:hypothetical protein